MMTTIIRKQKTTSVWSYRDLVDFRQFIRNLVNKSMSISDALEGFRELPLLPKRLGQLTVEEVQGETEVIGEIYKALKKMRAPTAYKLPYDKNRDIEADPSLKISDRLTQRGVAYRLRPKMQDDEFDPKTDWPTTMAYIATEISKRCKVLWPDEDIDREYLGIYAKARGMFYYRGRTTPIDFDVIGELASEAAVNIVIEKEGMAAVLEPFADKYRVALISTQGNFAEYVKRFMSSVIKEGTIVVTIVDDDIAGQRMARSTKAKNIGVNKKTVEWLSKNGYPDISVKDVQEIDPSTGEPRIEIDSILAVVKAEGLWKWALYEIEKLAPVDLRKSIDMPDNQALYAEEIADALSDINDYADLVTFTKREEVKERLSKSEKLYDADLKEKEIEGELGDKLAADEGMKMLIEELPKLIERLKEFAPKSNN